MRELEFAEHGPAQWIDGLSEEDVGQLGEFVRISAAGPNRWKLKPRGKVGVVRIGELTVRITPKVPTTHLLFLLGYAKKAVPWREALIEVGETDELVATVADGFSRLTERALLGGALHAYRPVQAVLPVLKGRVRVADQLRHRHGVSLPLEVTYQEFGLQTEENRLLKAAAERALRLARLRPETVRRLHWITRRLATVSTALSPLPAASVRTATSARSAASASVRPASAGWQPNRLNARYQTALGLAELILRDASFDLPGGPIRAEGFVLDMHVVFENFIAESLSDALATRLPSGEGQAKYAKHLDRAATLTIEPDFVWLIGGKPVLIVDAKYKASKHHREDFFQMVTYCSTLGLPTGHLIYVSDQDVDPAEHEVRGSGLRIVRHTLNLSRPPSQLLAAIEALATQLVAGSAAPTVPMT